VGHSVGSSQNRSLGGGGSTSGSGVSSRLLLHQFQSYILKGGELTSLKKSSTLWTPVWKADVAWVTIPG